MNTSHSKKEHQTLPNTSYLQKQGQQGANPLLASPLLPSTSLQNILETLPCKICVFDTHGHILLVNKAFQAFILNQNGVTIKPGMAIQDTFPSSSPNLQKAQILLKYALEGKTATITDTITDENDTSMSYEITYGPLLNDQNTRTGVIISFNEMNTPSLNTMSLPSLQTMLDQQVSERTAILEENNQALQREILERSAAENALRQSEQNFRMLTETVPQLIWIISRDGSPNYFNQKSRDFLGFSEHQKDLDWQNIIHPDDWPLIINLVNQTEKQGISFKVELRMRRASDSTFRWQLIHATPIQDASGKTVKWITSVTDINDQKKTEETLRQNEQKLLLLTDIMPHIVWELSPNGKNITYSNQRWFEYRGLTKEQGPIRDTANLVHPDDFLPVWEQWQHALKMGESFEREFRIRRASDGLFRWHLTRCEPIKDANGTIFNWLGTSTDIHDSKIAQEQLALLLQNEQMLRAEAEATSERLEQLNKIQSDFISIVSHEFRTTLTGIQGFSEVLSSDEFSHHEVKDYATDINTDAKRLTRMINDLLDLERMKSGKMTLELEEIDINHLIQEVTERAIPTSPNHTLHLQLDPKLPNLQGDSDKIIQVLTNLLSNAIKYAPNGGKVIIGSKRQKNKVHINIQDHGIGIPSDALEEIFAPYSRIDAKRTRYIKGTGLGLAIVRQIVEMHEGQVWAESILGEGSTFHVLLSLKLSTFKQTETPPNPAG